MKSNMWHRFYIKPFEAFIGLYVVVNGILTLSPDSVVKDRWWNILGGASLALPWIQIAAGLAKIVGIALGKSNLEAAGLITVAAMVMIRCVGLVSDGDVSQADINLITICVGIFCSNILRLSQIVFDVKTYIVK